MPKLKRTYENMDAVEETFRPFYEEKDGKAVLAVEIEGLAPASKLDEMRSTLQKKEAAHAEELKKFEGIDPDIYKDLQSRAKDLEDGKLLKRGELESVVKPRIDEATKPLREELQKERGEKETWKTRYAEKSIESEVIEKALPFGVKKGATKDLVRRARDVFKINDDGEIQAVEADGKSPKYHLGDPYTIEQFIKDTRAAEDGKHLFEENSGGGGDANKGNRLQGEPPVNPWDPKTLNRTEQGRILKANRPMAIRMAAKHGQVIQPLASATGG